MSDGMRGKLARCPECGWAVDQPRPPLPEGLRRVRGRLIALIVLLALAVGVWAGFKANVSTYSLGLERTRFVEPAFTPADVQRIAQGLPSSAAPGEFVRSVLEAARPVVADLPGSRAVEVGFVQPAGERHEWLKIGWPTPWVTRWTISRYKDAVAREGLKPYSTDPFAPPMARYSGVDLRQIPPGPRWIWEGSAVRVMMHPEETGGRFRLYYASALGMLCSLEIALLAAWVVEAARRRWALRRGRAVRGRYKRTALICLAMVLAAGWVKTQRTDEGSYSARFNTLGMPAGLTCYTWQGFGRLSLSREEVEALHKSAEGDRVLARAVLAAAPADAAPAGSLYLAATSTPECVLSAQTRTLSVVPGFYVIGAGVDSYVRRPDFGEVGPMAPRPGLSVGSMGQGVAVRWGMSGVGAGSYWVQVLPDTLALVLGVPAAAIVCIVLACRAVAANRSRRGLCPACAYPVLAGEPSGSLGAA